MRPAHGSSKRQMSNSNGRRFWVELSLRHETVVVVLSRCPILSQTLHQCQIVFRFRDSGILSQAKRGTREIGVICSRSR